MLRPYGLALCPLVLLALASGRAAGQPAAAPPSAAAPAETITDPEDTSARAVAPPSAPLDRRTLWRARATLRLGLDPRHQSSGSGTAAPYHEDVMDLLGEARAHLDHQLRPWLRLELGGRLWYHLTARRPVERGASYLLFNGSVHRNDFEPELLESLLAVSVWRLEVQAGLITEVLGATDLVNPNDVLTVRDLRTGLSLDPESSRFPVPLLKVETALKGFTLTGVWMPVFVPHRVDLFGSDFALLGPIAPETLQWVGAFAEGLVDDSVQGKVEGALVQTRSPRPFADSSFAARVGRRLGGWDLSLQYAWLHERLPVFRAEPGLVLAALPVVLAGGATSPEARRQIAEALSSAPLPVEGVYRRQHQVGLSLAGSVWKLGVSFDLAYLSREAVNLGSALPFVADSGGWLATSVDSQVLAYTAGLTYVRGEDLLVTLEGWHRIYLDLAARPEAERPPLLLGGPHQGGLALLARYRVPAIRVTLQLLALTDLASRSLIVTPEARFRWGDHLALAVGANVYEGAEASLGGRLRRNSQVFLTVQGF